MTPRKPLRRRSPALLNWCEAHTVATADSGWDRVVERSHVAARNSTHAKLLGLADETIGEALIAALDDFLEDLW